MTNYQIKILNQLFKSLDLTKYSLSKTEDEDVVLYNNEKDLNIVIHLEEDFSIVRFNNPQIHVFETFDIDILTKL